MKYWYFVAVLAMFEMTSANKTGGCNFVSMGANKNKCQLSPREGNNTRCCFVTVKKNSYSFDFCAEINRTSNGINQYKDDFKKKNGVKKISVECGAEYVKVVTLVWFLLYVFIF